MKLKIKDNVLDNPVNIDKQIRGMFISLYLTGFLCGYLVMDILSDFTLSKMIIIVVSLLNIFILMILLRSLENGKKRLEKDKCR